MYYTTGANFNVAALVDTDGNPVERYMYDPYGKVTILNGAYGADDDVDNETVFEWDEDGDRLSDVANDILYCGYRNDPQTGLFHVRNRYHDPFLGRFISRDPAGYQDGMSLYEYCRSGPLGATDAEGTDSGWMRRWGGRILLLATPGTQIMALYEIGAAQLADEVPGMETVHAGLALQNRVIAGPSVHVVEKAAGVVELNIEVIAEHPTAALNPWELITRTSVEAVVRMEEPALAAWNKTKESYEKHGVLGALGTSYVEGARLALPGVTGAYETVLTGEFDMEKILAGWDEGVAVACLFEAVSASAKPAAAPGRAAGELKAPLYRTWNQFQAGTKGQFASRAAAGRAWAAYKQPSAVIAGVSRSTAARYPSGQAQAIQRTLPNTTRGWRVGDPINNLTRRGNVPSWSAVRQRIWKNQALYNPSRYAPADLVRMRQGLAPQRLSPTTGLLESMHLHHNPPQSAGGLFDVEALWPPEHWNLHHGTGG